MSKPSAPLIVQADRAIFVEVSHPDFESVRERLMVFAELEKSPEHVHVYRVTPVSLWNAASSGLRADDVVEFLKEHSRVPVPASVCRSIEETIGSFGRVRLTRQGDQLWLEVDDEELLAEFLERRVLEEFLAADLPSTAAPKSDVGRRVAIRPESRGAVKLALARAGYPVDDLAGYHDGNPLQVGLRERLANGCTFELRTYQHEAVEAFHAGGSDRGGSGVVVLPCGAGKTVVGIGALVEIGRATLILTTNISALRQWKRELLEKTDLSGDQIGEYSGEVKQIRPVTLSTYQILTHRRSKVDEFTHFRLFSEASWGLIIYDEVHLLPAPIFRFTADIQATRRLGLTATLVREDGRETEVFSLVGPRKYDLPWRSLESAGFIATAGCLEIRVALSPTDRARYEASDGRGKFRLASENARKIELVREIVRRHTDDHVLVIGQYIDQLEALAETLEAPLLSGKTPTAEREELYDRFRRGEIPVLIVSKVANFAVDLPEAKVAIQVSGTWGSRQEEAQRLGRILRPMEGNPMATFYSVVTKNTRDQECSEKRQLFLTEQGYRYAISDAEQWLSASAIARCDVPNRDVPNRDAPESTSTSLAAELCRQRDLRSLPGDGGVRVAYSPGQSRPDTCT